LLGNRLAHWADNGGFDCWVADVPTHDKGNTLDLVFASNFVGEAVVGPEFGRVGLPPSVGVCAQPVPRACGQVA